MEWNEGNGDFGVRWQEFGKGDRPVTKQKFFKTAKAREEFCEKVERKDNFWRFVAWNR